MSSFQTTNNSPFNVADNTTSVTASLTLRNADGRVVGPVSVTKAVIPTNTDFEPIGQFIKEYTEFAATVNQTNNDPESHVLDFEGRSFAFLNDETPSDFTSGEFIYDGVDYGTGLTNLALTFAKKGFVIKNANLNLGKKVIWSPIGNRGAYKTTGVNLDVNGLDKDGNPYVSRLINVLWINDWNHPDILITPKITPSQQRIAGENAQAYDGVSDEEGLPEPTALVEKHSYRPNQNKWVTLSSSDMQPKAGEEGNPDSFTGVVITNTEKVQQLNAILQSSPSEITNRIIWLHSGPNYLYPNMIQNWTVNADGTAQLDYTFVQSGASYSINSGYLNIGVACTKQEFIDESRPGEYHYDFSKGFTNVDVYYHPEYTNETPDAYIPVLNTPLLRTVATSEFSDADSIFDNVYISGAFSGVVSKVVGDNNNIILRNSRVQYVTSCFGDVWQNNVLRCFANNGGSPTVATDNYIELAINQSLIRPYASATDEDLSLRPICRYERNYLNMTGTVHGQPISLYGFSYLGAVVRDNIFHNTQRCMSYQASSYNDGTIFDDTRELLVENNLYIQDADYYEVESGQTTFSFNASRDTHRITYQPNITFRNNSFIGGEYKTGGTDIGARSVISTNAYGIASNTVISDSQNFTAFTVGSKDIVFMDSISRVDGEFRINFSNIHDRNLALKAGYWYSFAFGPDAFSGVAQSGEILMENMEIVDDTTIRIPNSIITNLDEIDSYLEGVVNSGNNLQLNFRYKGPADASGLLWANVKFYSNIVSDFSGPHPAILFEREIKNGSGSPSGDYILDEPINNRKGISPPLGFVSAYNYYYLRRDTDPLAGTNQTIFSGQSYSGLDTLSTDGPMGELYTTGIDYDNCRLFDTSIGSNAASDGGQPGIRWNIIPTREGVRQIFNSKTAGWFSSYGPSTVTLENIELNSENRVFYDTQNVTFRDTR